MNIYVLFEMKVDETYWEREGLGRAIGACFDKEQADELARAQNLAYWRGDPARFAEAFRWELERELCGRGLDVIDDDELLYWLNHTERVVVDVRALDSGVLPGDRRARRAVLVGLAALLKPWNRDAAEALEEEA
jgi:hypothetical protein